MRSLLSRNSFAASAYRQKKPALSNGADAAFETTDLSLCPAEAQASLFDRVHVVVVPPVRRIAPVPTTEPLGQVCVDYARPPKTSLVQKRHHHSPARVSPIELQACGPVIEGQTTAAFQRRTSALQLLRQGRHGNHVPSGAVRWGSQVCGSPKRRDVDQSPMRCPIPANGAYSPIWLVEAVGSASVLALWPVFQRSHAELGATSPWMPGSSDP